MEPIKDIDTTKPIMPQFATAGGFTAAHLAQAVDIYKQMLAQNTTKFFSFTADICATGTRGTIVDMINHDLVDVIITTCGTLDHDLARLWKDYYSGSFDADDAKLHQQGVNRLGNVFIPNESYGIVLEERLQPLFKELHAQQAEWSTQELCKAVGDVFAKEERASESILVAAAKKNIPIFIPGPFDGAFGSQLWMYWQDHKDFSLNLFKDEQALADLAMDATSTGALMVGGGISKHHVIWWNQFRGGLDYAIGMTTATEYDGSLSGARVREAISWGKVKESAKHVTVNGDATVLLPLMVKELI